jgi:hypothetical protein
MDVTDPPHAAPVSLQASMLLAARFRIGTRALTAEGRKRKGRELGGTGVGETVCLLNFLRADLFFPSSLRLSLVVGVWGTWGGAEV